MFRHFSRIPATGYSPISRPALAQDITENRPRVGLEPTNSVFKRSKTVSKENTQADI
jgi:hypothetical protein